MDRAQWKKDIARHFMIIHCRAAIVIQWTIQSMTMWGNQKFFVYLLASLYDNGRMARGSVLSPFCLQLLSGFLLASYLPPLSQHKATPSSQRHIRLLHSLLADPSGRLWLKRKSCWRWSPGKQPPSIPGSPGAACRQGVYKLCSDQIPFAEHIIIFCYLQLNRSLPAISTPSTFQRE